jgi:hypothetical protein
MTLKELLLKGRLLLASDTPLGAHPSFDDFSKACVLALGTGSIIHVSFYLLASILHVIGLLSFLGPWSYIASFLAWLGFKLLSTGSPAKIAEIKQQIVFAKMEEATPPHGDP